MKPRSTLLTVSALLLAGAAGFAARSLQEGAEATGLPQPTEQHRWMLSHVGTWDAEVQGAMGPSKGTWTVREGPGGLWRWSEFESEMMGMPFRGMELLGYDPRSEEFTQLWVDSWSTTPTIMKGSYDPATRKLVVKGQTAGMDGQPVESTHISEHTDASTIVFSMHAPGPDGQDAEVMTITYRKR